MSADLKYVELGTVTIELSDGQREGMGVRYPIIKEERIMRLETDINRANIHLSERQMISYH